MPLRLLLCVEAVITHLAVPAADQDTVNRGANVDDVGVSVAAVGTGLGGGSGHAGTDVARQ